jgi:hypothetical protein
MFKDQRELLSAFNEQGVGRKPLCVAILKNAEDALKDGRAALGIH